MYLFARQNRLLFVCSVLLFSVSVTSCSSLPKNEDRLKSIAISDTQATETKIGKALQPFLDRHPGLSGYYILGNNLDAFAARLSLIDAAESSIDAKYYIVDDELTGNLFLGRLLAAADRGVRVRLLVDDWGTKKKDKRYSALDKHPNMSVSAFNPMQIRSIPFLSFLTQYPRVNRRMHNKSITIDNKVTIVGGRNIGDEYFSASSQLEYGDLDILGAGPIAQDVSPVFDMFWNDPYSFSLTKLHKSDTQEQALEQTRAELKAFQEKENGGIYLTHLSKTNFLQQLNRNELKLAWAKGKVLTDQPEQARTSRKNDTYSMTPDILELANQSTNEIIIVSPYFIPHKWSSSVFGSWRKKGIRVRVITNSLASNDVAAVHAKYKNYRKDLLRLGVEIYELKPDHSTDKSGIKSDISGLHAKGFIFDRSRLFVGSMNLDPRSTVLNTEMGIVVENKELAQRIATWIDTMMTEFTYIVELKKQPNGKEAIQWVDITDTETTIYYKEPKTSFWQRLGSKIVGWVPFIEGEL